MKQDTTENGQQNNYGGETLIYREFFPCRWRCSSI